MRLLQGKHVAAEARCGEWSMIDKKRSEAVAAVAVL